jgi:redox-sensitive bicupin YhaK (pirin superfamily)
MKTVFHSADTRGHADHGWLNAHHSFSFAQWYNPERVHFGALRVLNDDIVAPKMGFGKHPHDNMEIITIPMEGILRHQDSMGNSSEILPGEVQVMSAGTGIQHSEFNVDNDNALKLFQIWVFPREKGVKPRYDQKAFSPESRHNQWQQIVSPNPDDEGTWIHQDAWFHLADLDAGNSLDYAVRKPGNGMYILLIDGEVTAAGQSLGRRDAVGVTETDNVTIAATTNAKVLLMEVPMEW